MERTTVAAAVLQAAVRRGVTLKIVFARADRAWEAAARRIDGALAGALPSGAWLRLPVSHARQREGRGEITRDAESQHGPAAEAWPGEFVGASSDLDESNVAVREAFEEAELRVQRLEELAALEGPKAAAGRAEDTNKLDLRMRRADDAAGAGELLCTPRGGAEDSDQVHQENTSGTSTSLAKRKGRCEEVVTDWEKADISDLSLDSLNSASASLSLSAVWDHESPLASIAAHASGHQDLDVSRCGMQEASKDESLDEAVVGAAVSECLNGPGRDECDNPPVHEEAKELHAWPDGSSPLSVATALSQHATPCRTLHDERERSPHPGACGGLEGEDPDNGDPLDPKEQRRLVLERELRWTRQALSSRKQHLRHSRLAGNNYSAN